jgi:hypothetical protein
MIRLLDSWPYPLPTHVSSGKERSGWNGDYSHLISLLCNRTCDVDHVSAIFSNKTFNHARCTLRANASSILEKITRTLVSLSPECPGNRILGESVSRWIHAKKARILFTEVNVTLITALRLAALADSVIGDRRSTMLKNSHKTTTECTKDVLLNLPLSRLREDTSIRDKVKVGCKSFRDATCVWLWQCPSESRESETAQGIFVNAVAEPSLELVRDTGNEPRLHIRQDISSDRHGQVFQLGTRVMHPVTFEGRFEPVPESPTAQHVGVTERNKTKEYCLPNQVLARGLRGSTPFTIQTIA